MCLVTLQNYDGFTTFSLSKLRNEIHFLRIAVLSDIISVKQIFLSVIRIMPDRAGECNFATDKQLHQKNMMKRIVMRMLKKMQTYCIMSTRALCLTLL